MDIRTEDELFFMIRSKDGTHVYYSGRGFLLALFRNAQMPSISDIALPFSCAQTGITLAKLISV